MIVKPEPVGHLTNRLPDPVLTRYVKQTVAAVEEAQGGNVTIRGAAFACDVKPAAGPNFAGRSRQILRHVPLGAAIPGDTYSRSAGGGVVNCRLHRGGGIAQLGDSRPFTEIIGLEIVGQYNCAGVSISGSRSGGVAGGRNGLNAACRTEAHANHQGGRCKCCCQSRVAPSLCRWSFMSRVLHGGVPYEVLLVQVLDLRPVRHVLLPRGPEGLGCSGLALSRLSGPNLP